VKESDDTFSHFGTIPECHGQICRQTDGIAFSISLVAFMRDNQMWLRIAILKHHTSRFKTSYIYYAIDHYL